MDQELKHGVLKTKQEGHPSPRQTVLATQWDSVKSVSEGLAQERAYQQQHMHIEDEDTSDKETEDLKVYDSLEVPSHPPAKSQLLSYDAYSDLRYDPNWRTNLRRSGHFHGSPLISEEYYQVPEDKSRQSRADRQGLKINGGYAYIDTSSAIVVTPQKTDSESAQPYHLHPQDGQTSSVTSPHCHDHAFQLRSPEVDLLRSPTQKMSASTLANLKVISNKKLERQKEDIVERNKITLGRNTSRSGSYVRVHTHKQETLHNAHDSSKETASTENQEDSSDPELMWLQKTQQLQVGTPPPLFTWLTMSVKNPSAII
uniref:Junctional cadherin complex regulator n=1 Tax=Monopterus albus TaxID=43700 RepID=A0A3Q3K0J7_MONAL